MASRRAYTQVSVVRMFEDLPDLKKQAIMGAILDGRSISNAVTMANMQGPYRSVEGMRKYAESGNYGYGAATIESSVDVGLYEDTAWIEYLSTIHTVGVVDPDTLDLITVDEVYTSVVGSQGNRDLKVQYALQTSPIAAGSTFVSREDNSLDTVITANDGTADFIHLTIPIPVLTFPEHYVEYRVRRRVTNYDTGGDFDGYTYTTLGTYVGEYNEATNSILGLHSVPSESIKDLLYPIVPIRVDGVDYEDLDEAEGISKMLGKINIDPQTIVDGIKGNPNEGDIDDVFVGFGTSITEESEWAIAGLAHTFDTLYNYNTLTKTIFDTDGTRQSISIKEAGFNNTLSYNYITQETKVGTKGYTRSFTQGNELEVCVPNPSYDDDNNASAEEICEVVGSTNEYVFTIPNGNGTYKEIVVSGLTSRHIVLVPGFGERVHQFLGDEDSLVVPLFQSAVKSVPRRLQDDLVYGSLHMFAYSYDIIKLKWYQRGIFKAVLTIAAIAFAVFTYGATIASAFAVSTFAGALAIAKILAVTLLVDYAVEWLVEEVGGVLALILAVAVSLVTANFQSLTVSFNTSWYSFFSSAVKVHGAYINNELDQITQDQAAFDDEYEDRQEQLDIANDTLDWGVQVNLLELGDYRSQPNTIKGESSQEFFDRTTSVVDLPLISNNMITLYHEANLELPTVDPFSINPTHKAGFLI